MHWTGCSATARALSQFIARQRWPPSVRCNSSKAAAIFHASNSKLFPYGSSTELYRNSLSWTVSASPKEVWACFGPGAAQFLSATLLGRARVEPASSRSWPFLAHRQDDIESVIKRVAFSNRLEARGPVSSSGGFTDYTSRYHGKLADYEFPR